MKSIIKYLLYFLAIVLLIWWLLAIFKGKATEGQTSDSATTQQGYEDVGEEEFSMEDLLEDVDDPAGDAGDAGDVKEDMPATSETPSDADMGDDLDDILIDHIPEPAKATPRAPSVAKEKQAVQSPTPSGKYYVIVGSFIVPRNAQSMAKKVKKLGYPHAEVVNFDLSEYHTVLAGRYANLSEAKRVERALKSKGLDAYVQRRKQ